MCDHMSVGRQEMLVSDLLVFLRDSVPTGRPEFDARNVLVAVNGVDSSALHGGKTRIKDGDVVSIIPVVHGGGRMRTSFRILGHDVYLIRTVKVPDDPTRFLMGLREKFPDLVIQGIRAKYILSLKHARRIIEMSLAASRSDTMLSNRIETDLLMRFAATRQIDDAIKKVGLQRGEESVLVVLGKAAQTKEFFSEIRDISKPILPFPNNMAFIKKEFHITKSELGCVLSREPLEDILVERSAVLLH